MDPLRAPIDALQREMGKALDEAIKKQGGKVAFSKKAGLNRATLYRLLAGENVSTEVLLRTLRALGRFDLVEQLIAPPAPSPLELRPPTRGAQRSKPQKAGGAAQRESFVKKLALGQLPGEDADG